MRDATNASMSSSSILETRYVITLYSPSLRSLQDHDISCQSCHLEWRVKFIMLVSWICAGVHVKAVEHCRVIHMGAV